MRLSVNEFATLCRRAAVGAGIPFGLAEDAAAASTWLATAGLPGVQVFRRALEGLREGNSVAVALQADTDTDRLVPVDARCAASALFAGPALTDRILVHASGSGAGRSCTSSVDEPLLVLGAITGSRVPADFSVAWHRAGDGGPVEGECRDGGWMLRGWDARELSAPGPADVMVGLGPAGAAGDLPCLLASTAVEEARRRCYRSGMTIAADEYDWLNRHAREMLVADSLQSRLSGAGAGLRDND